MDDEPLIVSVISRAFRAHEVVGKNDGCEAIAHLMGDPRPDYDVIMCDLLMPECSGIDVHRVLKRDRPDLAQKMIFFTGATGIPAVESFLRESGRPVLMKPFDISELRRVALSVAAGEQRGPTGSR